jgi:hypothetical protein
VRRGNRWMENHKLSETLFIDALALGDTHSEGDLTETLRPWLT